eukprot:Hpha_TRINITY_DN13449_c0_g1::TRINITY_DN13449_c0_g1_i1::g.131034::m.131034
MHFVLTASKNGFSATAPAPSAAPKSTTSPSSVPEGLVFWMQCRRRLTVTVHVLSGVRKAVLPGASSAGSAEQQQRRLQPRPVTQAAQAASPPPPLQSSHPVTASPPRSRCPCLAAWPALLSPPGGAWPVRLLLRLLKTRSRSPPCSPVASAPRRGPAPRQMRRRVHRHGGGAARRALQQLPPQPSRAATGRVLAKPPLRRRRANVYTRRGPGETAPGVCGVPKPPPGGAEPRRVSGARSDTHRPESAHMLCLGSRTHTVGMSVLLTGRQVTSGHAYVPRPCVPPPLRGSFIGTPSLQGPPFPPKKNSFNNGRSSFYFF